MTDSASLSQSALDQIAEEFTAAIRRGETPKVEDFLAKYPSGADQLRSLLMSIAMIEGLKQESSDAAGETTASIRQLDDYTIVREIGRGGMGVVFEAIHQSLGRRVAVKVLASGLLGNTKHLTRFRREARAAARLRHPNIVSVFGVGQADGHHYYVMDFIKGMSLREWLQSVTGRRGNDLPTRALSVSDTDNDLQLAEDTDSASQASAPASELYVPTRIDSAEYFQWVSRIVATICDALHYAHQQGVLHRDIKPANLLIDSHGVVWITDFGLAKLTEQQAASLTGEIVGTPQYMPPESFEAKYDVRSETYGVGLLLFELLTLRPAIEGKNPRDVIRKAVAGVSTSPRKLNQHIPRDLETIVGKAVSHDPQSRYQTAGQLRDDLQCFLENRPISARRINLWERALRWSKREPTVAALTFATFASLFALAIVAVIGYARTSAALSAEQTAKNTAQVSLKEKTAALATADQQRKRAEKNLQVALDAFNKIMHDITDRGIEPDAEFLGEVADTTSPDVTPADAELLQSLLGFFDELAATNSEDLLAESAEAGRLAGDIYQRLGKLREADRAYTDALAAYQQLAAQDPGNLSALLPQAEIMNELAVITGLRGSAVRANQMFDQTRNLILPNQTLMDSPDGRFQLARAHRIFASMGARSGMDELASGLRGPGPPGGPRPGPRDGPRPGLRGGPPRPGPRPGPRSPRGNPVGTMFKVRADQDRWACDEAIELLTALSEEFPDETRYRAELARVYRDKAKVASRMREIRDAETAVRLSIDIFESLLASNRGSNAIRYELAKTLSTTEALGINSMLRTVRANELSSALLQQSPTLDRYKALKAHTLEALASHQMRERLAESSEKNFQEALTLYEDLIASSPELIMYRTKQAAVYESLAELAQRQNDRRAARGYLQQAIDSLSPPGHRFDSSMVARVQLQRIRNKLSRLTGPEQPK